MLSDALSSLHGKAHTYLTGNATTAIYLTLKALGLRGKRVGFAENVCPSVPMAVSYSGNEPVFLDIDPNTMAISLNHLGRHIDRIDVLIAVYSYGWVFDIGRVQQLCAEHDVFLLEDCAVAQGATIGTAPAGSFGDACIVSFGTGKIIEAGHGGAVLTDDRGLFEEIQRQGEALPAHTAENDRYLDDLSMYYNRLYNRYFRDQKEALGRFKDRALAMKEKCLCRFNHGFEGRIVAQLERLGENIDRRKRLARAFESRFDAFDLPGVDRISPPDGSVYWRFNLYVRDIRDALLFHLLDQGYRISSWYPSVRLFWGGGGEGPASSVCDQVAESILNLWVNQDVDEAYVDEISTQMARFVDAANPSDALSGAGP